jgi:hypothetical protein
MKKMLCIILMLWLPCFVMAASVMSMQMQLAELPTMQPEMTLAMADEMPCHHDHASPHTQPASTPVAQHHCGVCGYCVISGSIAPLPTVAFFGLNSLTSLAPLFMATPVHSQTYPPAIKPPIFM